MCYVLSCFIPDQAHCSDAIMLVLHAFTPEDIGITVGRYSMGAGKLKTPRDTASRESRATSGPDFSL